MTDWQPVLDGLSSILMAITEPQAVRVYVGDPPDSDTLEENCWHIEEVGGASIRQTKHARRDSVDITITFLVGNASVDGNSRRAVARMASSAAVEAIQARSTLGVSGVWVTSLLTTQPVGIELAQGADWITSQIDLTATRVVLSTG